MAPSSCRFSRSPSASGSASASASRLVRMVGQVPRIAVVDGKIVVLVVMFDKRQNSPRTCLFLPGQRWAGAWYHDRRNVQERTTVECAIRSEAFENTSGNVVCASALASLELGLRERAGGDNSQGPDEDWNEAHDG